MNIYIIGCGALGSNIAMNLAFDRRDDQFYLVDFDKVEARNYQFGTQQYLPEQLGARKTDSLVMNIYRQTKKIDNLKAMNMKIYEVEGASSYPLFQPDDLVIDCLDNFEGRDLLKFLSEERKFKCLHVGFSPQMTYEISWNDNYTTPEDVLGEFDICEAQGARSFIQYVSGLASMVVLDYLQKGVKTDLVGSKNTITKII